MGREPEQECRRSPPAAEAAWLLMQRVEPAVVVPGAVLVGLGKRDVSTARARLTRSQAGLREGSTRPDIEEQDALGPSVAVALVARLGGVAVAAVAAFEPLGGRRSLRVGAAIYSQDHQLQKTVV